MAGKSPIEWTEHTWNPIVGCTIVSPGCTNCYAMKMAARIEKMHAGLVAQGKAGGAHYVGTTKSVKGTQVWTGKLALAPDDILNEPLRRRKPTTYFVNSMGDLFHEDCPDAWIDRVFAVMTLARQHTFQVLTKRSARMLEYVEGVRRTSGAEINRRQLKRGWRGWPLPNVWLGVSAERQQEADERIPHLLATPAAVRFVSCEPLLGPIDLTKVDNERDRGWEKPLNALVPYTLAQALEDWGGECQLTSDRPALDWVIVGGESGPNARPIHPDWARSLRDQCADAGVPFFFKQWGEWLPEGQPTGGTIGKIDLYKRRWCTADDGDDRYTRNAAAVHPVGKRRSGRLLDGVEHNGFPEVRS